MMFYDEAVAELEQGTAGQPEWSAQDGPAGAGWTKSRDWTHKESGTTLRVFNDGAIVILNERLLVAGYLRYDKALQNATSMRDFFELARGLATRDKQIILKRVGPHNIRVS